MGTHSRPDGAGHAGHSHHSAKKKGTLPVGRILTILCIIGTLAACGYLITLLVPAIRRDTPAAADPTPVTEVTATPEPVNLRVYDVTWSGPEDNEPVYQAIETTVDRIVADFEAAVPMDQAETLTLTTEGSVWQDWYQVLLKADYPQVHIVRVIYYGLSDGAVCDAASVLGESYKEWLNDYFTSTIDTLQKQADAAAQQAAAEAAAAAPVTGNAESESASDVSSEETSADLTDSLGEDAQETEEAAELLSLLKEGYADALTVSEENFNLVLMNEDGSASVLFEQGTLTDMEGLFMLQAPANVMTGEYFNRRKVDPDKPMVALTYDDGPHEEYTAQIIECLQQYNSVATFFDIGKNVDLYPEITKLELDSGCEVGSHTYWHIDMRSYGESDLLADKERADAAFMNAIGQIPFLCRPPEGKMSSTCKYLYDNAFIGWSVDTLDWSNRSTSATVRAVKNFDGDLDGQVVLMHAFVESTVAATQELVPWLIEQGYQLVTISELMEYHYKIPLESHVYYAVDFFLYGKEPSR